jgi:hypothetical protein
MTCWTCNLVAGVADIAGRVLEKRKIAQKFAAVFVIKVLVGAKCHLGLRFVEKSSDCLLMKTAWFSGSPC